jgi:hypothetical protein
MQHPSHIFGNSTKACHFVRKSNACRQNTGGILGDDMGLGKTVQTAAFLIAVLGKKATVEDKCTDEDFLARTDRKKPVLIACPASLLVQVCVFLTLGACKFLG